MSSFILYFLRPTPSTEYYYQPCQMAENYTLVHPHTRQGDTAELSTFTVYRAHCLLLIDRSYSEPKPMNVFKKYHQIHNKVPAVYQIQSNAKASLFTPLILRSPRHLGCGVKWLQPWNVSLHPNHAMAIRHPEVEFKATET
jgi:hypothetical protein